MAKKSGFLVTPTTFEKKDSLKGGPGNYSGEPGFPTRTTSPNGVPEKIYEDHNVGTGKKELVYQYPGKKTT